MKIFRLVLIPVLLASCARGTRTSPALDVRLVTDEADAARDILQAQREHGTPSASQWARLHMAEGYQRLLVREAAMHRPLADTDFQRFLTSDSLRAREPMLTWTLRRWRSLDARRAAARAFAYLPPGAAIRARIYLEIKPRTNSFVFYGDSGPPGIFLYVDPALSAAKLENTMAHELHHIGSNAACASEDTTGDQRVRKAREWMSAFGEGRAMLAAAGGPGVHPHAVSVAADRARWDHDVANAPSDVPALDAFFEQVLHGSISDDSARSLGFAFFGVQGPWYTVGWLMAATVERADGRARLVATLCDPGAFLTDYNAAARGRNAAGDSLPLWPDSLIRQVSR